MKCGRCETEDEPVAVEGKKHSMPPGWSTVQIIGLPVMAMLLCRRCDHLVRRLLLNTVKLPPDFSWIEFEETGP